MHEALFEPIMLGSTSIANRIVRAAHGTRLVGEDFIRYHEERAKGGVGLSILQIAGVHPSSPTPGLPIHDGAAILPLYEGLASRLHSHGMKVFQQLWHGGSAFAANVPGTVTWSSSPVPHPRIGIVPVPMTQAMIDDVVEAFARGAKRVRDGGLDGIEIHGAHSYLVGQFLSPALNQREDDYGGSEENRLRFLLEILGAIRAEVGTGFPLGVRLSATDLVEGGLEPADTARIAQAIEPLVDFVDLSYGGHWHYNAMFRTMDSPLEYEIPSSEVVTRAIEKPTIVTGRIMTLDVAEHIVRSGAADMVSMVRALIADPHLVNKSRTGHSQLVRPCIGSNVGCIGGIKAGRIGCVVNPAAGRESTIPFEVDNPIVPPRRVLVIGGGPAGMEAARAAAMRGHVVELHEAQRSLGGQVRFAGSVVERADVRALTRWLEDELGRLGVRIVRSSFAHLETVEAFGADEVILATGSAPDRTTPQSLRPGHAVPGSEHGHVVTSWDALGFGGRADTSGRVLVFDDTGTFEAITVALHLAGVSESVTYVTRHEHIGWRVPFPLATVHPYLERLMSAGVRIETSTLVSSIAADTVQLAGVGASNERSVPVDCVVLVCARRPNRDVAEQLADAGIAFRQVGDANGTDDLQRAIQDGAAAGRAV